MSEERMLQCAASLLRDGEIVLVGVGLPAKAAALAQATHAPDIQLVYESGSIGARPPQPALSIGDATLVSGAVAALSLGEVFDFVIEGFGVDTAFVGTAEIDRRGRLNSTCIGD